MTDTTVDTTKTADTTAKTDGTALTDATIVIPAEKTADQIAADKVTADASAKAVADAAVAATAKAELVAKLEKDSKLAGEAGAKATADLKALRDKDAADAAKAEADKKAADGKTKDGKTDEDKPGAPEKYEDFTIPEGMTPVQGETMDKFKAFAKEKNLSQKDAQSLVDMQTGLMTQVAKDSLKAWNDDFTKTANAWVEKAKADPEIGGANYEQTLADGKAFIQKFNPSPEFQKALKLTGIGNHPEFMRLVSKAGKALKDDTLHGAERKPAEAARKMFPKSAP